MIPSIAARSVARAAACERTGNNRYGLIVTLSGHSTVGMRLASTLAQFVVGTMIELAAVADGSRPAGHAVA